MIKIIPVLVPIVFVASYAILFYINPISLSVVDRFGLAGYNIMGMQARGVAVAGYVLVGLLGLVSCKYILDSKNFERAFVPVLLLGLTNVLWISFGLSSFVQGSRISGVGVIVRSYLAILCGIFGLLSIAGNNYKSSPSKLVRFITLLFGSTMLILLIAYFVILRGNSWLLINIAFAVYFLWYAFFGLTNKV